jgi:hypothetical protein
MNAQGRVPIILADYFAVMVPELLEVNWEPLGERLITLMTILTVFLTLICCLNLCMLSVYFHLSLEHVRLIGPQLYHPSITINKHLLRMVWKVSFCSIHT